MSFCPQQFLNYGEQSKEIQYIFVIFLKFKLVSGAVIVIALTGRHRIYFIYLFIYCSWVVTRWQWLFYM